MKRWWLWLVAVLPLMAACGQGGGAPAGEVRVVTSIGVLADFVRQVGGDRVAVTSLLPPGADPHTFQLSPRDAQAVAAADVIFVNGLGLEGPTLKVMKAAAGDTPIVALAEGLAPGDDPDLAGNPHLWLDVGLAILYVERIRDSLIQVDPPGAQQYAANSDRYVAQLRALDGEIRETIASIPPQRRKLVTFHDSFAYLARRYGLAVVAYVVKSPGREPSAAAVADLMGKIRREGIPAVFREPQLGARILELTAKDLGLRVGVLYSDALSQEVPTYIEMMRFNANQLVENLR